MSSIVRQLVEMSELSRHFGTGDRLDGLIVEILDAPGDTAIEDRIETGDIGLALLQSSRWWKLLASMSSSLGLVVGVQP